MGLVEWFKVKALSSSPTNKQTNKQKTSLMQGMVAMPVIPTLQRLDHRIINLRLT
jgi:hypothetical protein